MTSGTCERDKTGQNGTNRDMPAREGRDKRDRTRDTVLPYPCVPLCPPAGVPLIVIGHSGTRWVVVAIRPYVRKDGESSFIVTWSGKCKTCGLPFQIETGRTVNLQHESGGSGNFGRANCDACKKPHPTFGTSRNATRAA